MFEKQMKKKEKKRILGNEKLTYFVVFVVFRFINFSSIKCGKRSPFCIELNKKIASENLFSFIRASILTKRARTV